MELQGSKNVSLHDKEPMEERRVSMQQVPEALDAYSALFFFLFEQGNFVSRCTVTYDN